jgi:hypothetical protein
MNVAGPAGVSRVDGARAKIWSEGAESMPNSRAFFAGRVRFVVETTKAKAA